MTSQQLNLAGEFVKAKDEGGRRLTLDEYVDLVDHFAQMAVSIPLEDPNGEYAD